MPKVEAASNGTARPAAPTPLPQPKCAALQVCPLLRSAPTPASPPVWTNTLADCTLRLVHEPVDERPESTHDNPHATAVAPSRNASPLRVLP